MKAIYFKEMNAYFKSPLGFAIVGIFFFFAGFFYTEVFAAGIADSSIMFEHMFTILLFLVPILTMRLFSEEKRQKTDQALLSSSASLFHIVAGKFLAALSVLGTSMSILVILQIVTTVYAARAEVSVDWLIFIGNMLGMLLLASALIAVGIFISALTESQMVAAVIGFAVSLLLIMLNSFAHQLPFAWLTNAALFMSFMERYYSFARGIISYADAIFFISVVILFMFFTAKTLERKRYA